MRRFSKGTLIAWGFAALFLISSVSLLLDGNIGAFFTGLVLSVGLAFFGWRRYVKQLGGRENQDFEEFETPSSKEDYLPDDYTSYPKNEEVKIKNKITDLSEEEVFDINAVLDSIITHEINSTSAKNTEKTEPPITSPSLKVETESAPEKKTIVVPAWMKGFPLAYHYEDVKIFISKEQEANIKAIDPGMSVELIQEPTNEYDNRAVMVTINNTKIGYLYKGNLQDMVNDFIEQNLPITSHVTLVNDDNHIIKIFLGFYREKLSDYETLKKSKSTYKTYKLTSNTNSNMQDEISVCQVGNRIDAQMDYEKLKYIASCGGDIGYFPKSAEKFLENECEIFIDDINENDNGKFVVTVAIFY